MLSPTWQAAEWSPLAAERALCADCAERERGVEELPVRWRRLKSMSCWGTRPDPLKG